MLRTRREGQRTNFRLPRRRPRHCAPRLLSNAIEVGLGFAGCVARNTPSAHVSGVRPFSILDVDLRALVDEKPDDVVGSAIRGAVQRGEAHRVDDVHVHPERVAQFHRFEQRLGSLVVGLIEDPVDARGSHQRGGARERRDVGIGLVCEEQPHHVEIAGERRGQERGLPGEVHPRQRSGNPQKLSSDRRHFLHPHVRIGAAFEQEPDQVEKRRALDAVHERGIVGVHVARLDRGPERRSSVPVAGADIGALVDQQPRDVDVIVRNRGDERRDAVGFDLIDVGAAGQQALHDIEAAVARRVLKRRQASGNRVAQPAIRQAASHDANPVAEPRHRIRQDPRRRGADSRRRVHPRAALDQQLDDRRMIVADGDHQGGLLEGRILAVDRRAPIEEQPHGVERADVRRRHQRCFAGRVGGIGIGARIEQQRDHRRIAVRAGEKQRSDAVAVGERRVGAGGEHQPRHVQIVRPHGPVERGGAVAARRVDVNLLREERAHGGGIAVHRRLRQPRIGRGVHGGHGSTLTSSAAKIREPVWSLVTAITVDGTAPGLSRKERNGSSPITSASSNRCIRARTSRRRLDPTRTPGRDDRCRRR